MLLTHNRKKENIILLTAKPIQMVAAQHNGFLSIPLMPIQQHDENDYQLSLLEQYLFQ